ncbi:hypothetical protein JTB14_018965 [Gonioctena quinquepunctata]|nr:hypothetical protein JTB14_018965 [Gonioctena quinquepunctata]
MTAPGISCPHPAPLDTGKHPHPHRSRSCSAGGIKPLSYDRPPLRQLPRSRRGRLHQHHPLETHPHLPETLRRLHRLLDEGQRHFRAGPRRARAVLAAHREHEGRLQGQEEAHVFGEGAVRLIYDEEVVRITVLVCQPEMRVAGFGNVTDFFTF